MRISLSIRKNHDIDIFHSLLLMEIHMKKQFIFPIILLLFCHSAYGMDDYKNNRIAKIRQDINNLEEIQIDPKDALCYAAYYEECTDELELLLNMGINPDQGESTALYNACHSGALTNVTLLLKYHANTDIPDSSMNDTPLMVALRHGYLEIFNLLLENGANPNLQDKAGSTALMFACGNDSFYTVAKERNLNIKSETQVFAHIPLNIKDSDLRNETELIRRSCIYALLKAGARTDIQCKGKTAIELAAEAGLKDIVELMLNFTPEAATLTSLCTKYIKEHKEQFEDQDFDILPIELKSLLAEKNCNNCKALKTDLHRMGRCGRCKKVYFCDVNCQRNNWKIHKLFCGNQIN